MWQRQEDDVVACEDLGGRLFQHPVCEVMEVRLDLSEAGSCATVGRDRADLTSGWPTRRRRTSPPA